MDRNCMHSLAAVLLLFFAASYECKKLTEATEENCEVCVQFMKKFIDSLDAETKKTPESVETAIKKRCKNTKKDDNRLCYYIGALEESATGMVNIITKPISWGVPADKVCMKLYRQDQQICDLKYEKTLDFATVNLNKLKVKDLKNILSDWDASCKGCTEKQDFVKMIEDLMKVHEPAAWEKRQKSEL